MTVDFRTNDFRANDLWTENEFLQRIRQVPVQKLEWNLAKEKGIELWMRRDDLLDAEVSGNKFYKLFYNLLAAKAQGAKYLVSFGGAFSNHLYALAAAGQRFGFKTIGVVRGEQPAVLNQTLLDLKKFGMDLHFVSREEYRELTSSITQADRWVDKVLLSRELLFASATQMSGNATQKDFYVIPEGGANDAGIQGAVELGRVLAESQDNDYTTVCLACGTATTFTGVVAGLNNRIPAIGFSVLKGDVNSGGLSLGHSVKDQLSRWNSAANEWRMISGFHDGGYAKKLSPALKQMMRQFEQENQIYLDSVLLDPIYLDPIYLDPIYLDPVYTAKMFWGVTQLMQTNYWPRASRLLLIHSGGLQGRRGFDLNAEQSFIVSD